MYISLISLQEPSGRLDANGGQISGFCGHTFHNISCTFGHSRAKSEGVFSAQASIPGIQLVPYVTNHLSNPIWPVLRDCEKHKMHY